MAETSASSTAAKKGSALATFFTIVAYICLTFWVAILLDEIQTSEAYMGAPFAASLLPNWLILWQPFQFVTGTMDPDMIVPFIVGWIVELLVLGFTFAFELVMTHAKRYNSKLAKVFGTFSFVVFGYDGWSNYNAHFAHGDSGHQVMFAVGMAAGAVLLPYVALGFFKLAQLES